MVMLVRILAVIAAAFAAGQSLAEPMNSDAARRFIMGKRFAYHCFDGTRGEGRVYGDGSVAGTIQIRGNGPEKFVTLPSGTLKVQGQSYCASIRGIPFEPCFKLDRTDQQSFRGALLGHSFAYCNFIRRASPSAVMRTTWRRRVSSPRSLHATASAAEAKD
jgi:hypothetical protein